MPSPVKLASLIYEHAYHPTELRAMINWAVWRDPLHRLEDDPEASGLDRESMKKCWEFLPLTSRSFASVIMELEGELSRVICIYYLILRALDTVEDDMTIPIEKKAPMLENFHEYLEIDGWTFQESGPEEHAFLLKQFDTVITEYKLLADNFKQPIRDITRNMGHGMARFCRQHAESGGKFSIATLEEFDLYCHYVAGLVGEGLSRIFSASGKEIEELGEQLTISNSMGLMLQKTNILRDFREDVDAGRVFWPAQIWSKYATEAKDLTKEENHTKALWAISEMTVDALSHATDSLDYLTLLRNQSVFNFCAIPQVMAVATLDVCFMNPKVMQRNVKIRKGLAVTLMTRASNPRDVAYIIKDFVSSIHAKARPLDPSYVKLGVLAGRVEQWCETRYPSFVVMGQPAPQFARDWQEGMDVRIKQLPAPDEATQERIDLQRRMEQPAQMSSEDYKFMGLLLGAIFVIVLLLVGISLGVVWLLFLREGAPFSEVGKSTTAKAVKETMAAMSPKVEL